MTHLLERLRPRRKFSRADVLSRFGETICLPAMEIPSLPREQKPQAPIEQRHTWEEEPERWDGMS